MSQLKFSYDGFGINITSYDFSPRFAVFRHQNFDKTTCDQIGHLFEAAPEMLEALEAVYEVFQEGEIVFKGKTLQVSKIRKAIERARGK